MVLEMKNGVVDAEALDESAIFVAGVADGAEDAEEVDAGDGIFVG
jgi:hypothetical protein